MKLILFISVFFTLTNIHAQTPSVFDAGVKFTSVCCGPPEDTFLKSLLKQKEFKRISSYKAAGCGREGEFSILFSLKSIKPSVAKKFIKTLKIKINRQNTLNTAKDSNSGGLEFQQNIKKEDLDFCRSGIAPWKK